MFRGTYEHAMTKTGRVSIPSRFREVCRTKYSDETFVVTNFGRYLLAYPLKEWSRLEAKLSKVSMTESEVTAGIRYLVGSAQDCPVDNQGRVLVPPNLRERAGIENQVVLVGMMTKIELWSKETWDSEDEQKGFETLEKSKEILAQYGL